MLGLRDLDRKIEHLKRRPTMPGDETPMHTVTYGEVAEHVGGLSNEGVGRPLGYIRDHICRKRGLPWLNAMVVGTATRRPSHGFLVEEGKELGKYDEAWWRGMMLSVFAYPWDTVKFD
jgi:hypothetical protein